MEIGYYKKRYGSGIWCGLYLGKEIIFNSEGVKSCNYNVG